MARTIYNPLTLNADRSIRAGSFDALNAAIRRGADLRIATEFRHNEHIDPASTSTELVREVAEFRETYLIADRWSAAFMTLRMPVDIPVGFGPRPSMSFFMYNQDGQQAIARPYLDGPPAKGEPGPTALDDHRAMPRYHQHDSWDGGTNAPSSNFVYDFDSYHFLVNDRWQEVLAHAPDGSLLSGAVDDLADAFGQGLPVKLAIRGLCADLTPDGEEALELFAAGKRYDLVVSDVVMPNMDGPSMARQLRAEYGVMKILFMSGYAEEQLRQSINLDNVHFLPKPFSVQQIAAAVRDALIK